MTVRAKWANTWITCGSYGDYAHLCDQLYNKYPARAAHGRRAIMEELEHLHDTGGERRRIRTGFCTQLSDISFHIISSNAVDSVRLMTGEK